MAKCMREHCDNEIKEGAIICDFCMEALRQAHAAWMAKKKAKESDGTEESASSGDSN